MPRVAQHRYEISIFASHVSHILLHSPRVRVSRSSWRLALGDMQARRSARDVSETRHFRDCIRRIHRHCDI
eukprot:9495276-Pyramimonas_sp.AAC.1